MQTGAKLNKPFWENFRYNLFISNDRSDEKFIFIEHYYSRTWAREGLNLGDIVVQRISLNID